jgi:hypothetical protein
MQRPGIIARFGIMLRQQRGNFIELFVIGSF